MRANRIIFGQMLMFQDNLFSLFIHNAVQEKGNTFKCFKQV